LNPTDVKTAIEVLVLLVAGGAATGGVRRHPSTSKVGSGRAMKRRSGGDPSAGRNRYIGGVLRSMTSHRCVSRLVSALAREGWARCWEPTVFERCVHAANGGLLGEVVLREVSDYTT
jgi:hypothetical protein